MGKGQISDPAKVRFILGQDGQLVDKAGPRDENVSCSNSLILSNQFRMNFRSLFCFLSAEWQDLHQFQEVSQIRSSACSDGTKLNLKDRNRADITGFVSLSGSFKAGRLCPRFTKVAHENRGID